MVPYYHLFLLSVFILWFSCYVSDIFCNDHLFGKELSASAFRKLCQFMYLVISLLVLRAGCGI